MKEIHKAVINFAYFTANFTSNFIEEVWSDEAWLVTHLNEKFHSFTENGFMSMGGFMRFFMELSMERRIELLEWVRDNYLAFDSLK